MKVAFEVFVDEVKIKVDCQFFENFLLDDFQEGDDLCQCELFQSEIIFELVDNN